MNTVLYALMRLLTILPVLLAGVAILYLGKVLFARTMHEKFQEQLNKKDNPAFGLCFLGYLLGLGIAIAGSILISGSIVDDLINLAVGGVVSIVLMRLSIFINDKLILYKFSIYREVFEDRNVGTGFVVAGGCVATGLMLNGVMLGESSPLFGVVLLGAVRDMVVYWVLGQAILVAGGHVFYRMARYDVQKEIGTDRNVAAGISFGGFLVALGIIIRASLVGADSNILVESAITLVSAAAGIILLMLVQFIMGHLLFRSSPLATEVVRDRNAAAGAVSAACSVAVAILLAAAIVYHPPQVVKVQPAVDPPAITTGEK